MSPALPASLCREWALGHARLGRGLLPPARGPRPQAADSHKASREAENAAAIGGLRDAHRAVQKVPGWAGAGALVRRCALLALEQVPAADQDLPGLFPQMLGSIWVPPPG